VKTKLWALLFACVTHPLHRAAVWLACWTEFFNARAAFRSLGNEVFRNKRHNFARFETIEPRSPQAPTVGGPVEEPNYD